MKKLTMIMLVFISMFLLVSCAEDKPEQTNKNNETDDIGYSHQITLAEAEEMIAGYSGELTYEEFNANEIYAVAGKSEFVRIYHGMDSEGHQRLIIIGVNDTGDWLAPILEKGRIPETE